MTTTTTNMNLVLPDVSVTVGPTWATELNTAYNVIDSHDHSTGKGVAITPSGLNISSDLTFAQNNATNLRSARLYNNSSISLGVNDKTCVYALNNELYYVDGSGNNVQITSGGSVNIGSTSALTLNDTAFILQYFGDTSRKFKFSAANIPSSTTRTLTLADSGANDTIPTLQSTSVFKNKVLSDTTTTIGQVSDNTKALKFSLSGATTAKTMTIISSHTNDRNITLPDASDTLVGKATTDDLTNKSFNGTTVIKAANLLSFNNSANTYSTSLAAGSNVANATFYLPISDGSNGQAVITNGSGQLSFTAIPTAAGNVAAQDSNVAFTNADNRHQVILPTAARTYTMATTSIPSGDTWSFENRSAFLITVNSSGTNLIGYIYPNSQTQFTALQATPTSAAHWNVIYDSLPPAIVTANDSAVTFTQYDNRFQVCTPTAARTYTLPTTGIVIGDAWTFVNTSAFMITVNASGGTTESYVRPLSTTKFICTSSTPTTNAHWIHVYEDSSEWASYTPTVSAGFGTATSITGKYKVLGDSLSVMINFVTGTVAGSLATVTIPTAFTIDSTKVPISNTSGSVGVIVGGYSGDSSAGSAGYCTANTGTSTTLVYCAGTYSSTTSTRPGNGNSNFPSSSNVMISFTVPIV